MDLLTHDAYWGVVASRATQTLSRCAKSAQATERQFVDGESHMREWGRISIIAVLLAVACQSSALADDAVPSVVGSKFEFFVHDVADSRKFYVALGFSVAHMKTDGYSTLTSGSTVIALTPLPWWLPIHWFGFLRHPPMGTEVVLYSADLELSNATLKERGYSPGEIRLQPWGHRDFRIADPDGYYIRLSEGVAVPSGP